MGLALQNIPYPEVRVSLYTLSQEDGKEEQYDVDLTFQVDKWTHTITKDWMWKENPLHYEYPIIPSGKGKTIEAEDVFMWIRQISCRIGLIYEMMDIHQKLERVHFWGVKSVVFHTPKGDFLIISSARRQSNQQAAFRVLQRVDLLVGGCPDKHNSRLPGAASACQHGQVSRGAAGKGAVNQLLDLGEELSQAVARPRPCRPASRLQSIRPSFHALLGRSDFSIACSYNL